MKIECAKAEQVLLKRNIKADKCKFMCEFKPQCTKPPGDSCGQYILSLIEWVITDDKR